MKAILLARLLLGGPFLLFGLNGFFEFMPPPPEPPAEARAFLGALVDSGYLMTLIKLVEVGCGAMLVLGIFVPLALVLLAPVLVNIVAFHLMLSPAGIQLAMGLVLIELLLAWAYWPSFATVLDPRAPTRFDS
jgi:uncharacterized membrane protein YphA (DoxX/SURF4 family)